MISTAPTAVEIARYGELAVDIVYLRSLGKMVAPFRGDFRIGQLIVDADDLRAIANAERARRAARGSGNGVDLSAADAGRLSKPSDPAAKAVNPGPPPGREPTVKHGQGTRSGSNSKEWTEVTREKARVRREVLLTIGVGKHYGVIVSIKADLLSELGWSASETLRLYADSSAGKVKMVPDGTGHFNVGRTKKSGAVCRFGAVPGVKREACPMLAPTYRVEGAALVIDLPEQIVSSSPQQGASDASRT